MEPPPAEPPHPSPAPEPTDGAPGVDAVTFCWRPGCGFCAMLRRGLRRRGIPLDERNIWTDDEAAAVVRAATGGDETVPTVVVDGVALVNPRPGQVEQLLRQRAPHLLPSDDDGGGGVVGAALARLLRR